MCCYYHSRVRLRCGRVVHVCIETELVAQAQLDVQLLMLDLDVLVQRALGAVRALAGLHGTPVMPLYLIGSPPEALLPVVLQLLALLDLLTLLLQLIEPGGELVALVEELAHLGEEDGVGEEEAAELVIEAKIVVLDLGSHVDYYR